MTAVFFDLVHALRELTDEHPMAVSLNQATLGTESRLSDSFQESRNRRGFKSLHRTSSGAR